MLITLLRGFDNLSRREFLQLTSLGFVKASIQNPLTQITGPLVFESLHKISNPSIEQINFVTKLVDFCGVMGASGVRSNVEDRKITNILDKVIKNLISQPSVNINPHNIFELVSNAFNPSDIFKQMLSFKVKSISIANEDRESNYEVDLTVKGLLEEIYQMTSHLKSSKLEIQSILLGSENHTLDEDEKDDLSIFINDYKKSKNKNPSSLELLAFVTKKRESEELGIFDKEEIHTILGDLLDLEANNPSKNFREFLTRYSAKAKNYILRDLAQHLSFKVKHLRSKQENQKEVNPKLNNASYDNYFRYKYFDPKGKLGSKLTKVFAPVKEV